MMKSLLRPTLICLTLIPGLAFLFTILITIAMQASLDKSIADNLAEDQTHLQYEYINTFNGRRIDLFTECIGVSIGLADTRSATSILHKAIRAPVVMSCEDMQEALTFGVPNGPDGTTALPNSVMRQNYSRYWHGYAVVARPLLSVLPYRDFRGLVYMMTALLGTLVFLRINRDFGIGMAAALALPFWFINFAGPMMLITKAAAWWVLFGGILFIASSKHLRNLPYIAFFCIGALTAFTDFLTTPILNFTLPVLVYFLYAYKNKLGPAFNRPLQSLAVLFSFWAAGYGGLWVAKFALSYFILGPETLTEAMHSVQTRLRGTHKSVSPFPLVPTLKNIEALKGLWAPLTLIVFGILPFAKKQRRAEAGRLWRDGRILIIIGLIPIAWMEILSNHSQIHGTFTHVNLVAPLMILSLILLRQVSPLLEKAKT